MITIIICYLFSNLIPLYSIIETNWYESTTVGLTLIWMLVLLQEWVWCNLDCLVMGANSLLIKSTKDLKGFSIYRLMILTRNMEKIDLNC